MLCMRTRFCLRARSPTTWRIWTKPCSDSRIVALSCFLLVLASASVPEGCVDRGGRKGVASRIDLTVRAKRVKGWYRNNVHTLCLGRLTQARLFLTQARLFLTQARLFLTQARLFLTQARLFLAQALLLVRTLLLLVALRFHETQTLKQSCELVLRVHVFVTVTSGIFLVKGRSCFRNLSSEFVLAHKKRAVARK